jgi:cysteine desulfurase
MDAYLDHNATSIIDKKALEVILHAYTECYANPSSVHAPGRKARARYLKAKDTLASHCGVSSQEVFFTASATEALNWILNQKVYKHIISSTLEHAAIFNTLKECEKKGTRVSFIQPGSMGQVTGPMLESAIGPDTDLIILGSANSETGIIQNITELSHIANTHRIPFVVDAVGLLGRAPFTLDPHVTAYVFSSHKIHGPKGIAAIIHRRPQDLKPLTYGGYQEGGKRAGTENVPLALGFAYAFDKVLTGPKVFTDMSAKQEYFESHLKAHLDVEIIGSTFKRVCNTSCVRFCGVSGETLLQCLDDHHVYASHGSACSSGALEPSRVLLNMDLGQREAKECIRFSFSHYTTYEELDFALDLIINVVKELSELITK